MFDSEKPPHIAARELFQKMQRFEMSFLDEKLSNITVGQLFQQMAEMGAGRIAISQNYESGKKFWLLVLTRNEDADQLNDCLQQLDAEDLAAEVEEG